MAGRDPTRPQLEFPALVAEIITQLRLSGQVGRLNFSDEVIPAFLIGSRGINFGGDLPSFNSSAVFSGGVSLPAANTVIVDTGPLPAGTYDGMALLHVAGGTAVTVGLYQLQHRDAANGATLATLITVIVDAINRTIVSDLPLFGYELGLNERLRAVSPIAPLIIGGLSANIFMRIRPTP